MPTLSTDIERASADNGGNDGDPRAARQAATGLYHVTAAALFAHEADRLADPVRLDLARLVLAHKLGLRDPLAPSSPDAEAAADRAIDALVSARQWRHAG